MRVLVKELPDKPHASAGHVLDLPVEEAQLMLKNGTAVPAQDEPLPRPDPDPEPHKTRATHKTR